MARTAVNLESVRTPMPHYGMADEATLGTRIRDLMDRSGLKGDALAKRLGYNARSSLQRIYDPAYDPDVLSRQLELRLVKLVGLGEPPITASEIRALAGEVGAFEPEAFEPKRSMARPGNLPRNVPMYGTGLAALLRVESDGSKIAVEQIELNQAEVVGYMRRPETLDQMRDLYGIYVAGSSMYPRFDDGEPVLVDPRRNPRIADDVVVHLLAPDEGDGDRVGTVLVKRLRKQTHDYYELEQFNPPLSFRVRREQVRSVHRIVTYGELLS
ncbi:MAG: S24 family peptidase [Bacteroidia bacterium]